MQWIIQCFQVSVYLMKWLWITWCVKNYVRLSNQFSKYFIFILYVNLFIQLTSHLLLSLRSNVFLFWTCYFFYWFRYHIASVCEVNKRLKTNTISVQLELYARQMVWIHFHQIFYISFLVKNTDRNNTFISVSHFSMRYTLKISLYNREYTRYVHVVR